MVASDAEYAGGRGAAASGCGLYRIQGDGNPGVAEFRKARNNAAIAFCGIGTPERAQAGHDKGMIGRVQAFGDVATPVEIQVVTEAAQNGSGADHVVVTFLELPVFGRRN